ncbi:MAG: FKBP-type peptidyl-prolyl cis-trans isomerase [Prevotellaceae bacterium]|jgi:hypothetical protein|nr:FKBP-type peptidyl-prolyl cis-trans isomerase [Prevotellaceae bacterium]
MKYLKLISLSIFIIITACSKDKEADYIANQEKIIDQYWSSIRAGNINIADTTIVDDIFRVVLQKGDENIKVSSGDIVSFYYVGAVLTSRGIEASNIFDTNIATVAQEIGLTIEDFTVREDVVGNGRFIAGLEKGLLQMYKGEISQIIFTSKYGYGDKASSVIPRYSPIIFQIEIKDVKKQ